MTKTEGNARLASKTRVLTADGKQNKSFAKDKDNEANQCWYFVSERTAWTLNRNWFSLFTKLTMGLRVLQNRRRGLKLHVGLLYNRRIAGAWSCCEDHVFIKCLHVPGPVKAVRV